MISIFYDEDFIHHYTGIDISSLTEEDIILLNDLVGKIVKSYLTYCITDVRPDLYEERAV